MSETPNNHPRSENKRRHPTVDDNVIYLNFGRNRNSADADGEETPTLTEGRVNLNARDPRRQRTDSQRKSDALVLIGLGDAMTVALTRGQPQ